MRIFTFGFLLIYLSSCGSAKTMYADNKYDLCMQSCDLKYSKYNYQERSKCQSECASKKQEDAK